MGFYVQKMICWKVNANDIKVNLIKYCSNSAATENVKFDFSSVHWNSLCGPQQAIIC